MAILNLTKNIMIDGGVDKASYEKVKGKIQESNRRTILIFASIGIIAFLVLSAVSCFVNAIYQYRFVYMAGLILTLIIWVVAKYPGAKSSVAVSVDMYGFAFLLLLVGIVMGTVLGPNELAAAYIAFLLAVPQMFTDRPWKMHLMIAIADVVFILMAQAFKNPATVGADIVNAVVFGILSIALETFTIVTRIKKYVLEDEIRFLAESDQLTGLKNRYCYQRLLDAISFNNPGSVYCVYLDANGLHELNDTKGHEAGDEMLKFVASSMQRLLGKENVFRIGGDEFVALGIGKTADELVPLVTQLQKEIDDAGYHAAVGLGTKDQGEDDINAVIKNAERAMYKDKSAFYIKSGRDRRSR